MLGALVSLLFLQISLTYGWDEDRKAPGPTDCTGDQNQTFCGITFHCKCIWKMPTLMEAKDDCGIIIDPVNNTEVHPILFPPRRGNSLKLMNTVEENSEDDLWDEISDDENEGDEMEDDEEDMNPDPDTEGCGVLRDISRNNDTFGMESLRSATIKNRTFYLPGNMKTVLEIVHQKTGGKCRIKQRSRKNKPEECKKKNLKEFKNFSIDEYEDQANKTYVFRVGLGIRGMKDQEAKDAKAVKDAVNQAYIDRYDCLEKDLPCFLAPKKRKEILCQL